MEIFFLSQLPVTHVNQSFPFAHCHALLLTAHGDILNLDSIVLRTFHCFSNQNSMLDHTAVLALVWSCWKTTAVQLSKLFRGVALPRVIQKLLSCQTGLAFKV